MEARTRSQKDSVENLQAAEWDLGLAAALIVLSAVLLAVVPVAIALLHR